MRKVLLVFMAVLFLGCKEKEVSINEKYGLSEDTMLAYSDKDAINNMVDFGSGIVLFVDDSKLSESVVSNLDQLTDGTEVPVLVYNGKLKLNSQDIQRLPAVLFTVKEDCDQYDILEENDLKKYLSKWKESVLEIVEARNEESACDTSCEFKPFSD